MTYKTVPKKFKCKNCGLERYTIPPIQCPDCSANRGYFEPINIEMETIEPLNFNRPMTSQIVIKEFSKIIDSQDKKGIEKYGKTIDEAVNYDWELMALEEAADLQKYLVKEIIKLRAELQILKEKSWFKVYQENLELTKEIEKLSKMIF